MKKMKILYILSASAAVISVAVLLLFSNNINTSNINFLASYGIEVKSIPVETADIKIPKPFDLVYKNYNELQKEAGFDLEPYSGMSGKRYTYIVTNYPEPVNEEVRANVICIDNKQVGGDVMTVSLYGFMLPLNFMQ